MRMIVNSIMILMLAAVVVVAGCSKSDQETPQTQVSDQELAAQEQADTTDTEVAVVVPETKPVTRKQKPATPTTTMVTIPAGTVFTVSLETLLRTDSNKVGDEFTARTVNALDIAGTTVIPAGAEVHGSLTAVEEPHRTKGKAKMTLSFATFVDAQGKSHSLATQPMVLEAAGDKVSDEEKVAAGGVIGGIIGAVTSKKKGKGAAIGAAIGAAAGGAVALATKGGQLELTPGQQFNIEMAAPTEIPVITKAKK